MKLRYIACYVLGFMLLATKSNVIDASQVSSHSASATKKESLYHKQMVNAIEKGDTNRIFYLLEHQLDDSGLQQGLEGGKFDWEALQSIAPRLATTVGYIYFDRFFLLTNYEGWISIIPWMTLQVVLRVWDTCCNTACYERFQQSLIILWLNSMTCFIGLCSYLGYTVYKECRQPSYLMLAIRSRGLNKTEKKKICLVLINLMQQKNVDIKRSALLVQRNVAAYRQVYNQTYGHKEHKKKIEQELQNIYGIYWLRAKLWLFFIYCMFYYGSQCVDLCLENVTAMHLAYQEGLDEIVQAIENIDPTSIQVPGYKMEDTLSILPVEDFMKKYPSLPLQSTILKILQGMITGKLPFKLHLKPTTPDDYM